MNLIWIVEDSCSQNNVKRLFLRVDSFYRPSWTEAVDEEVVED